jgi:hypothetical protein
MARALAQRLSDESEVRHRDSSRRCRRDVGGEGESIAKGGRDGVWNLCPYKSAMGLFRDCKGARAGGVEREGGGASAASGHPKLCRLSHRKDSRTNYFSLGDSRVLQSAGQLNCVLCDGGTWAGLESQFLREDKAQAQAGRVESMRSKPGCWMDNGQKFPLEQWRRECGSEHAEG